ncbi:ribokinase [Paucilactobacillus nenjiangensis]|jgi:ribokinase|uniref:Deoxyribokinase n=1 Tax=Paucilactobacillus nenjiangensis TaxID=1296540 RepID=A0A5P1X2R3_9LACO|nr:ribokinase [Paucilactobacillus nenjiangensis]QER66628.1 ribokinase [Paucilactobacillus nenjiangensis]
MIKSDVLIIGSNMMDLITYIDRMPIEGETVEAPDFEMGFGGKGANQAVAAARLGSRVSMITKVGNDAFGQQQLTNFKDNKIDVSGVGIGTKSSGVAPIFVSKSSNNSIIIIKGANNELTPDDLQANIEIIKNAKIIVLENEIPLETNYAAIDLAQEFGIPILLNPAPARKDLDLEYVKKVDYFAPNETELATLTGLPASNLDEIKVAAHDMVSLGVKHMIVTLGSRGVLSVTDQDEQLINALKVDAVDTTGAGDSIIGAFAHYLAEGKNELDALNLANQYAAMTVTRRGTQKSYPTKAEVEAHYQH